MHTSNSAKDTSNSAKATKDTLEELIGIVDRIIFHNSENGFTIFVLQMPRAQTTIIKGYVPTLQPGEQVTLQGAWIMHPKFGKQFDAQSCITSLPTSLLGIKKYLSSGMIKGIGPVYAEKLVKAFGQQVLEVIDKQPYRLHEVSGIGQAIRVFLKNLNRILPILFVNFRGVCGRNILFLQKHHDV